MAKQKSVQREVARNYVRPFLILLACAFLVYGNGIVGDFVFDDASVVVKRPELHSLVNIPKLLISPYQQNAPQAGLYRPLTMISFAVNESIFGREPWGFHAVNIFLAGLNATLVFWLLYWLWNEKNTAYLGALLFLAHPLHVEAVTSIVGRGELLMALFSLLAFYTFVHRKYWLSGFYLLLALLSKETAVAVIGICLLYDWRIQGAVARGMLKKYIPIASALGAYAVLRVVALGHFIFHPAVQYIENPLHSASYLVRLANACKVFLLYLGKIIWPYHLSADYSFHSIALVSWHSWQPWLGILMLLLGVYLLISKRISYRIALGTAFFLLPYLIISNIIVPIGTMMAERLMYLPILGICILITGFIAHASHAYPRMRYVIMVVAVLMIGACGVRTYVRNADWHDNRTLFVSAVNTSPNSVLVHTNLAVLALKDKNWDEGKRELAIAKSIYEDYAPELNLFGVVSAHEGDLNNAEYYFKKAIAINPYHIDAYRNLIQIYTMRKQFDLAKEYIQKAIVINPAFTP